MDYCCEQAQARSRRGDHRRARLEARIREAPRQDRPRDGGEPRGLPGDLRSCARLRPWCASRAPVRAHACRITAAPPPTCPRNALANLPWPESQCSSRVRGVHLCTLVNVADSFELVRGDKTLTLKARCEGLSPLACPAPLSKAPIRCRPNNLLLPSLPSCPASHALSRVRRTPSPSSRTPCSTPSQCKAPAPPRPVRSDCQQTAAAAPRWKGRRQWRRRALRTAPRALCACLLSRVCFAMRRGGGGGGVRGRTACDVLPRCTQQCTRQPAAEISAPTAYPPTQVDRWRDEGLLEPDAAAAVRALHARSAEWLDLSGYVRGHTQHLPTRGSGGCPRNCACVCVRAAGACARGWGGQSERRKRPLRAAGIRSKMPQRYPSVA